MLTSIILNRINSSNLSFDPNYHINEADLIIEKTVPERINNQNEMQDANINNEKVINSSNMKEFNVLNIKLNDKEDKIKKKTIVYFVFLFDKVISFDKNKIINSDLEALVSCNESSLVFWFDELYIYISRKEGVRHKIYYKISRSNISSNYNRLIASLCIENKSYYQFSSESFFLYEYVMTRRDDSFSNFKEDVFLDELFKIVKKHLCDNNIAIIQKHLVKEIIPSITDNEFSVFESQEIRDVCCYLLGKGFSKISVLNSIRELSPFDYYSAIQKNKISLASSTFNTNEDEEIIINKELAILQSELNQINEIKNPIKFLDDNIQLHIYSIKDNLNISEEAVFNNIVKVIYPKDYDSSIKQYNEKLSRKNEIEKLIKVLNFKLGNHIVNPSAIKKKEISNNELKSKTKNDIPYIRNQGYKLSFLDVEYSSFLTNTYVQSKSSIFIFVNPADQDDYLYDQINNKHIIKGQGLVGNQHFGSNINDQILKHRRNDIKVFLFKKNNNTSDCLFIDQIRYYSHSFEEEYLKNKRRWVIKFVFKSI